MSKEAAKHVHEHAKITDKNQSFWDLATIQLTGVTSLPVLSASIIILQNNSLFNATCTILVGNLLLWFIRLGIVTMSRKYRQSTLDISKDYLGKVGGYLIAIVLLLGTLAWYIAQTTLASNALAYLIPINIPGINYFIQVSVIIGIISTLFCMEGIVVLRRLCVVSFPLLMLAFLGVVFSSHHTIPTAVKHVPFSLEGFSLILGTSLGVTADLPTFFRHSRSWRDSINALTTIQVLSVLIGFGGLFLGTVILPWEGVNQATDFFNGSPWLRSWTILLIFASVICANVANVYSGSVGWELLAPKAWVGRKEYLILGLGLTILFIIMANIVSMDLLLKVTDAGLVNLCVVLIWGYILNLLGRGFPDKFDQWVYLLAWVGSTTFSCLHYAKLIPLKHDPLFIGTLLITGTTLVLFSLKASIKKLIRLTEAT